MSQHYSDPKRADDVHSLPNVEVFYLDSNDCNQIQIDNSCDCVGDCDCDNPEMLWPGWYWHACFPGCLPDSEPNGPFATEQEALADAQENDDSDEDSISLSSDPDDWK